MMWSAIAACFRKEIELGKIEAPRDKRIIEFYVSLSNCHFSNVASSII